MLLSEDQHTIAVTEKAEFFRNGLPVSVKNQVSSGEGGNQNEQSGARQMKIGDEGIDHAETETGPDEKPCPSFPGNQSPLRVNGRLQSPGHGGADGKNPPSFRFGPIDRRRSGP